MTDGEDTEGVRPLDWLRALQGDLVLDNRAVPSTALALMNYAPGSAKGRAWVFFASGETLAALARVSVPTIERGLRALREAGFLELHRRGGGPYRRANEFRLSLPAARAQTSPVMGSDHGAETFGNHDHPSPVMGSGELASHQTSDGLPSNQQGSPITGDGPTEEYSTEEYSTEGPPLPRTPQGVLAPEPPTAAHATAEDLAQAERPNHRPHAGATPAAARNHKLRGLSDPAETINPEGVHS